MPKAGGRYQPLADFLTAQSANEVTLSFAQIEAIVKWPLPPSASLREWWTSTAAAAVQVRLWQQAGWEVVRVARRDHQWVVTFRRRPVGTTS